MTRKLHPALRWQADCMVRRVRQGMVPKAAAIRCGRENPHSKKALERARSKLKSR